MTCTCLRLAGRSWGVGVWAEAGGCQRTCTGGETEWDNEHMWESGSRGKQRDGGRQPSGCGGHNDHLLAAELVWGQFVDGCAPEWWALTVVHFVGWLVINRWSKPENAGLGWTGPSSGRDVLGQTICQKNQWKEQNRTFNALIRLLMDWMDDMIISANPPSAPLLLSPPPFLPAVMKVFGCFFEGEKKKKVTSSPAAAPPGGTSISKVLLWQMVMPTGGWPDWRQFTFRVVQAKSGDQTPGGQM